MDEWRQVQNCALEEGREATGSENGQKCSCISHSAGAGVATRGQSNWQRWSLSLANIILLQNIASVGHFMSKMSMLL